MARACAGLQPDNFDDLGNISQWFIRFHNLIHPIRFFYASPSCNARVVATQAARVNEEIFYVNC
jgi:hypothetical protein